MNAADLVQRVWLSTPEAAEYAGRHPKTVMTAAADGSLRSAQRKPGCPRRYKREWLDAWVEGRPARRVS